MSLTGNTPALPSAHLSSLEVEALFLPGGPALCQAGLDLSKPSLHMLQLHLQVFSQLGCFYSLGWAGTGRRGPCAKAWEPQSTDASVKHPEWLNGTYWS